VWVLGPLVAAALVGLGRVRRPATARLGVLLFLLAATGSLLISRQSGAVAGDPTIRYWTGVTAALGTLGLLTAALVAGERARPALRTYAFGWRQPAAVLVAGGVLAGTVTSLFALLSRGVDQPLTGDSSSLLPVFAAAEVGRATSPRLVVLDGPLGGVDGPVRYAVVRDPDGPRLGDADVTRDGQSGADRRLTSTVRAAAAGQPSALPGLAEFGVSMLVVRDSGAHALARIDDIDGLDRVPTTGALVWRSQLPTGELVILGPHIARTVTAGHDLPATAQPRPLDAGRGRSHTTVPGGSAGRLLVLAEPASSHWHASVDGKRLAATTAYGWAQAWRLPATGGHLDLGRSGDHRAVWVWIQLAVVVSAALLALPVAGRRHDDDSAGPELTS
jgi:hypothetical protein